MHSNPPDMRHRLIGRAVRHALGMPGLLLAAGTLLGLPQALALPTGPQVVVGQATTSIPAAGTLQINQFTQTAILNWQSFGIAPNETVRFVQPGTDSVALNRVVGNDASRIFGNLIANGQVFLINPNGVLFAPGSRVDTGALVASTAAISDADFLAGRYQFSGSSGEVRNQGTITALPGGYVLLAGQQVTNDGDITARQGSVGLLAGNRFTLDRAGDGLVRFSVDAAAIEARVANAGRITADGGQIALLASAVDGALATVVNQAGQLRANTVSESNGIITLGGDSGAVSVSGSISATGDDVGELGGQIRVLGDRINLQSGAVVDASGQGGGGLALVGGALQGKGAEQKASYAFVDAGARIDVSATGVGHGGQAVVWSNRGTQFYGAADARGGAGGGDGGLVEVSGRDHLVFAGRSDRSAAAGRAGTLLLDPTDLTIDNSADANINGATPFVPTASPSILTWNSIRAALAGGNVVVTTTGTTDLGQAGDITIAAASGDLASANTLTLRAAPVSGSILVNAAITNTGSGGLSLEADGGVALDGAVSLAGNLAVATQGFLTQSVALSIGGTTSLTGGAQSLTLSNAGNHFGGAVSASGSNITLRDSGALNLGTWITTGNVALTAGGALTQSSTLSIGGSTTVSAAGQDVTLANANNRFTGSVSVAGRDVSVRDSGALVLGTSAISGAATINAAGGLSQIGAVTVGGTSSITAADKTVSLPNASNNFSGAVSLVAKDVTLTDANALTLGASTISGDATIGAGGALTQTGALSVNGSTTLNAAGQTITLSHAANDFGGGVAIAAKDVALVDANALTLGTSTITGNAALTAGGSVTQTGALSVAGTTSVTATGQAVTLANSANDFAGAVSVTASSLSLRDASALVLGSSGISGNATLVAGGALTQTGALTVGGTTAITATGQTVNLGNGSNDFTGAVSVAANTVTLADANALVLGASTVGGTLTTTTGGALAQTGALVVSGATSLNAVGQDITLSNAGNDFTGAVAIAARNATLTDSNSLSLGASTITGTANLGAGSALTQTGALTVGSTSTLTASGGDLTLDNAANDFQGSVSVSAAAVSLRDANDLTLGTLTSGTNKAVQLVAGGLLNLPASGINSGTADLTLSTTGQLATQGALSAANIALTGGIGVTLGHAVTTSGNLTLATTNAAITQTGGTLTVAGTTTLSAGSGTVALGAAGNDFAGTVSATAGSLTLRDANVLALGATTVSGDATLSSGGALTQTGALTVGGSTTVTAAGQDVTLTQSGNNFTGAVGVTARNLALTDANALVLGPSTLSGTAAFTAGGAVTQNGAVSVTGATTITATGQDVTLANAGNDFGGAVTAAARDLTLTDASGLVLGATTLSGNAGVTAAGPVTQTGALLVGGTTSITATGQDVTLANAGNDFAGAVSVTARDASLRDASALALGASTLTGTATWFAGGAITQTGALTVGGATTLTATGQDVTLALAANEFTGPVSVNARNLSLRDATALQLGASTLSGTATLVTGGALTQTGAVTVSGATSISALGQDVTLANAANDFGGAVSLTARDVSLRDATALQLGTSTIIGAATLISGGALTQTGTLAVTGNTTLVATGQDVVLDSAGNDFAGAVSATAQNLRLRDANSLVLGVSTLGGNATLTAAGPVTQTGALAIAGTTVINAAGQDVQLANVGNDFGGAVTAIVRDLTLRDANALALGTTTLTGNATLTGGGALTQAGPLAVSGTTTITAAGQNVTLDAAGNDFGGTVAVTAKDLSLRDVGALSLAASTLTGNAALTSGGALTQTGALTVGGITLIAASGQAVTLTAAGNDFGGAVSATAAALAVRDTNALVLGASTVSGALQAVAGGPVSQTGALAVAGSTTITATDQDVTLANAGNDFSGAVAVTGKAVSLRDANALTLAASTATGALSLTAGGPVTQTGALGVGGNTTVTTTGQDVTLADAGNDFVGTVGITAKDVSLRDANALTLGSSALSGSLTAQAGASLTQSAAMTVAGNSTLSAGGDLLLDQAGNDFQGSVNATGAAVSLRDASALTVTSLAAAPNKSVSLRAGGLLTLPGTALNTGAGDLTLSSGSTLLTTAALSGNNVALSGASGISLGNSVSAGSSLSLASSNASISQTGGTVSATGSTTITAGSGSVALGAAGNDFGGAVAVTARDLTLRDANALALGTTTLSGNAALTAGGPVTQSGAVQVTGTTSVTAAGQDVTLNQAGNDFGGAVTVTGKDVSLRDHSALVLGPSAIGGALAVQSGGPLSQAGALTVTGNTTLSASGQDIILDNAGNDFGGTVAFSGRQVSLRDATALALGTGTVSGDAVLAAGGPVTQAGALTVSGTTSVNAAGQNITLDNAGNDFGGALSVNGRDVSLRDATALSLGASTITGAATLAAGGALTQTGALTVSGNTTIDAAGQSVTLDNASNDFTGTVAATVKDLALRDATALQLAASTLSGTATLTAGGAVTQTGPLRVTGSTTVNAAGQNVMLDNAGNDFGGVVAVTAEDLALRDANALQLGTTNATGAATLTSGGALTQSAAMTIGGATSLASAGDITLDNAANDFQAAVTATGAAITLRDTNALTVASLTNGANKALNLRAGGLLTLPAQSLATGTADLALTSGAGLATNGAISGGAVSLTGASGVTLSQDVTAGNTLAINTTNAPVTQQSGALRVTGTTTVAAGTGNVTLASAANDFGGAVGVTANTLSVRDANALALGPSTLGGNLTLVAGGPVTQTGAVAVGGTSTLTATGQPITLNNTGNDFTGTVTATGPAVALADKNALTVTTNSTDASFLTGGPLVLTVFNQAGQDKAGAGRVDIDTGGNTLTWTQNGYTGHTLNNNNVGTVLMASGAPGRAFKLSPLTAVVNFYPYSAFETRFRAMINTTNMAMLYNGVPWGTVMAADATLAGDQAWLLGLAGQAAGNLAGTYSGAGSQTLLGVDGLSDELASGASSVEAVMGHDVLALCDKTRVIVGSPPCPAP